MIRRQYKQSVCDYKSNKTNENLKMLLQRKKLYIKELKLERKRKKINKLSELSKAKAANDSKQYWQLINRNNSKKRKVDSNLKAIDFRKLIETRDLQINSTLDIEEDTPSPNINTNLPDPENILNDEITMTEVSKTLKSMKNSKSSGPDGMVNEILKDNIPNTVPILTKIFNNIFTNNEDEMSWESSWIVPIYKKG